MPKRGSPSHQSVPNRSKQANLPPEIAALLEGQNVHIPDPERFFVKKWELQAPLVADQVKKIPPDVFHLEPEFRERFMVRLQSLLASKEKWTRFEPSDWIALALSLAASSEPVFEQADPFFDGDWQRVQLPGQGNGAASPEATAIGLRLTFGPDPEGNDDPTLTIEISGEALWIIQDLANIDQSSPERRLLQERAKSMWDHLARVIGTDLGIQRRTLGRPNKQSIELPAWLHHHFRYSWQRIAQKLCKEDHERHLPSCIDKYRKQAKLYWERESKKYAAMARRI